MDGVLPSQESMEEARASNAALDEALRSYGVVDREFYFRLRDAYTYQTASTVGWVEARLKVLHGRIDQGHSLALFMPASGEQVVVEGMVVFEQWAKANFPDAELSAPGR